MTCRTLLACFLAAALLAAAPGWAQEQSDVELAEGELAIDRPSVLAQFTTAVEDREPVDQITFVSTELRKIYFFTDLRGLTGQTVAHRWIFEGQMIAEVSFEVRGPRWRVWSSKDLLDKWIGDWTVEIVNSDGEVIAAESFTYSAPDA